MVAHDPLSLSRQGGTYIARIDLTGLVESRDFFIDNLPIRIRFIIVMIRWTGLAPWVFEFPFQGSLTSTLLGQGGTYIARIDRLFERKDKVKSPH